MSIEFKHFFFSALFLHLICVSHQITAEKECQEYENEFMGSFNGFSNASEFVSFNKFTKECFSLWFCEKTKFVYPKNGKDIDATISEIMTKIHKKYCEEIGKGQNIENTLNKMENETENLIKNLKKDPKLQEKVQNMVEMELSKNRKLNEKIQNAMERRKVNSFYDLLNAAFQTFFGNCKNCSIMPQKELSGRRKRRMAKHEMGNTSNTANEQNNFSIAGQNLVTQPTVVHNSNETGLELVTHSSDDNDHQNGGTNRVFLNAELPPQNRNLSPTRQILPEDRATPTQTVDHHPANDHHVDIPPVAHANVHELSAEQGHGAIPIAQPARQNQAVNEQIRGLLNQTYNARQGDRIFVCKFSKFIFSLIIGLWVMLWMSIFKEQLQFDISLSGPIAFFILYLFILLSFFPCLFYHVEVHQPTHNQDV